jgi:hypothetical protein
MIFIILVDKKQVFGSSIGRRGGGCQTLACALGVLAYILILLFCGYM